MAKAVLQRLFITLLVLLPTAVATSGQQTSHGADEQFARSEWAQAAKSYSEILRADPTDGRAWQNLGECKLQLKSYGQAIEAFQHAVAVGYMPHINQINVARVYAEKDDRAKVLQILEPLLNGLNGGRIRPFVGSAAEFQRYKNDPQFKAMLEAAAPCRAPEYRQFDFWVGDWEVHDPSGNVVGRNSVTLEQDGCLIVEHWKDSSGWQTGTSFNYYDVRDKKWHQLYIDNSGNAGAFPAMAGEVRERKMVLQTDPQQPPLSRWTWYALDSDHVRQMSERMIAPNKWQIGWDSTYVRLHNSRNQ